MGQKVKVKVINHICFVFSFDRRQLIWKADRAKFFFPLSCVCRTLAILAIEDLADWISVSRNRGGLS